jgi:hypothetical protein
MNLSFVPSILSNGWPYSGWRPICGLTHLASHPLSYGPSSSWILSPVAHVRGLWASKDRNHTVVLGGIIQSTHSGHMAMIRYLERYVMKGAKHSVLRWTKGLRLIYDTCVSYLILQYILFLIHSLHRLLSCLVSFSYGQVILVSVLIWTKRYWCLPIIVPALRRMLQGYTGINVRSKVQPVLVSIAYR